MQSLPLLGFKLKAYFKLFIHIRKIFIRKYCSIKCYGFPAKEHGEPHTQDSRLFFFIIMHLFLNIDVVGVTQCMKFYLRSGYQLAVQEEQTGQNTVFPGEHRHKCYPNIQAAS